MQHALSPLDRAHYVISAAKDTSDSLYIFYFFVIPLIHTDVIIRQRQHPVIDDVIGTKGGI